MKKEYIKLIKNNKQIRVTYDGKNDDGCDDRGWWSEELWCYDKEKDMFRCYYPKSSYEKDFYTEHNEREAESAMQDAIWLYEHRNEDRDEVMVSAIKIEDHYIESKVSNNALSTKDKVIQKINKMTEKELEMLLLILNEKEK